MDGRERVQPSNRDHEVCSVGRKHTYGDDTETLRDSILYCWIDRRRTEFDVSKKAKDRDVTLFTEMAKTTTGAGNCDPTADRDVDVFEALVNRQALGRAPFARQARAVLEEYKKCSQHRE